MIFNRRVRSNFNRETRENREQKGSVPCSSDTVQGREGRKETGVSAIFPCSRRSRVSRFMELGGGGGVSPGDGGCVSRPMHIESDGLRRDLNSREIDCRKYQNALERIIAGPYAGQFGSAVDVAAEALIPSCGGTCLEDCDA